MGTMMRLFKMYKIKMETDNIYFITHTHKIMRQNDRVICAHFYFAVQNCYCGTAAVSVDHIGHDAYSDWTRGSDAIWKISSYCWLNIGLWLAEFQYRILCYQIKVCLILILDHLHALHMCRSKSADCTIGVLDFLFFFTQNYVNVCLWLCLKKKNIIIIHSRVLIVKFQFCEPIVTTIMLCNNSAALYTFFKCS